MSIDIYYDSNVTEIEYYYIKTNVKGRFIRVYFLNGVIVYIGMIKANEPYLMKHMKKIELYELVFNENLLNKLFNDNVFERTDNFYVFTKYKEIYDKIKEITKTIKC